MRTKIPKNMLIVGIAIFSGTQRGGGFSLLYETKTHAAALEAERAFHAAKLS